MFDLALIGSGFGGSLLALIARRLGKTVLLLEKGSHPRFVIGESSTPLADLLWLELTQRYDLPELSPFAKWGTWRRTYPDVACGLKRGFTFYHHRGGKPFAADPARRDQLIVAASPRDEIADTHWYRPDFDHHLVREARRHGVEYQDHCEVTSIHFEADGARLSGRHHGVPCEFRARFVVDASNHGGPLARSLGLREEALPHLPATQGLYTHFRGVRRLDGMPMFQQFGTPPYPVDDAAVHHVFDGGWIWVLRFVNGITSAGVACTEPVARRLRLDDPDRPAAWRRLLAELPTVAEQFADAEAVCPWVHQPRLAFRLAPTAGTNWALLPSAAGFVDPLLSSGFTLNLLGIERLARALAEDAEKPDRFAAALARHARETAGEQLALEQFVSALYARMGDFAGFVEMARLYFCAVIWCETARRLGRPEVAGGLLMREHPEFARPAEALCAAARAGVPAESLRRDVDDLLQRFDLGGLAEVGRRPWYPVLADDLRRGRERIGASADEVDALLRRAGF